MHHKDTEIIEIKGKTVASADARLKNLLAGTDNVNFREQLLEAQDLLNEQLRNGKSRQAVHLRISDGELTASIGGRQVTTSISGANEIIVEHIRAESPDGGVSETRRKTARGKRVKLDEYEAEEPTTVYRKDPTVEYTALNINYLGDAPDPERELVGGVVLWESQPSWYQRLAQLRNRPDLGMFSLVFSPRISYPTADKLTLGKVRELEESGQILGYFPGVKFYSPNFTDDVRKIGKKNIKPENRKTDLWLKEKAVEARARKWGFEKAKDGTWTKKAE